jgi:CRP-like cAMP-binding protein
VEQLFKFLEQFQAISEEARLAILKISTPVYITKNTELQAIGKTCKTIYFIKKGIARIYYLKDGIDITESFAWENQLIVRVESLFTNKPSTKAIQAIEETEIIAIDATKLFALYDEFHEIERLFRKVFEASHVETINRIESIQFHSAEERYHNLLHESPEIIQRVPLKYVSSYLGITQVSLSRIRAKG